MTPAELLGLLPVIEAVLRSAPEIISDIEEIIARVKGGSEFYPPAKDPAENMQTVDAELEKFK